MPRQQPLNLQTLVLIIAIVAVVSLTLSITALTSTKKGGEDLLTVTGTSELQAEPDLAELYLSVKTLRSTASEAARDNAEAFNKAFNELSRLLGPEAVESVTYSLTRVEEYDPELRKSVFKGYRAVHSFKASVKDLSKAGEALDAAVNAGVNEVDSARFTLSEEAMRKHRLEAIALAARNARLKAEGVADALGVSLGSVVKVDLSEFRVTPYYAGNLMMAESGVPSTKLVPGTVPVTATVSVQFRIS